MVSSGLLAEAWKPLTLLSHYSHTHRNIMGLEHVAFLVVFVCSSNYKKQQQQQEQQPTTK